MKEKNKPYLEPPFINPHQLLSTLINLINPHQHLSTLINLINPINPYICPLFNRKRNDAVKIPGN